MESFWNGLQKPFFVLAPMADVTDPAYRRLIAETARPDVTWTEFVSADGLYATRERKGMKDDENPLMRDLLYTEGERPIVAQLFSSNPEAMAYAAKLCAELGFDGVDINMGCPDKSIEKQGSGAGMIKNPEKAKAVIEAARSAGIPVSVKTRLGYNTEDIDGWIRFLLEQKLPVLTVHMRARKEMSKVAAHWDLMPRIVALRDEIAPDTLIVGNGDVENLADARQKVAETGCDGVMLGRAIFGNPWLFENARDAAGIAREIAPNEKLDALLTLARYFDELKPKKSFHILKKHVKAFVTGWPEAAALRAALMETEDLTSFETLISDARTALG